MNPDIFESDEEANSFLVSYRTIDGDTAATEEICRYRPPAVARFKAHALNTF